MVPAKRVREKQSSEVIWTSLRRHSQKTSEQQGGGQAHGDKNHLYRCWAATNHIYVNRII